LAGILSVGSNTAAAGGNKQGGGGGSSSSNISSNTQLIYLLGFTLWLLTFNGKYVDEIENVGLTQKLVQVVKSTSTEKIIRIYCAVFRNILQHINASSHGHTTESAKSHTLIIEELIGGGLLSVTEALKRKRYKDVDLQADLEFVAETLRNAIERLSNLELYSSELSSGNLTWSPAHTNEQFWRENIHKLDGDNYRLIRRLVELLTDDSDEVREIAAHDVGEVARFHPEGKTILAKLNAKPRLMALLKDKNPKVQKQALLAIQKMLVNDWQALAKASSQGVQSLVQTQKK